MQIHIFTCNLVLRMEEKCVNYQIRFIKRLHLQIFLEKILYLRILNSKVLHLCDQGKSHVHGKYIWRRTPDRRGFPEHARRYHVRVVKPTVGRELSK